MKKGAEAPFSFNTEGSLSFILPNHDLCSLDRFDPMDPRPDDRCDIVRKCFVLLFDNLEDIVVRKGRFTRTTALMLRHVRHQRQGQDLALHMVHCQGLLNDRHACAMAAIASVLPDFSWCFHLGARNHDEHGSFL